MNLMENAFRRTLPLILVLMMAVLFGPLAASRLAAQQPGAQPPSGVTQAPPQAAGGEANLRIPDLTNTTVPVTFFGMSGHSLLTYGLIVCALGLIF